MNQRRLPTHLKAPEEIVECEGVPGLVDVLREEGMDAARCVSWDTTGWHRGQRLWSGSAAVLGWFEVCITSCGGPLIP